MVSKREKKCFYCKRKYAAAKSNQKIIAYYFGWIKMDKNCGNRNLISFVARMRGELEKQ